MKPILAILFFCIGISSFAQNEFTKWYFGNHTGLDFMTTPPTVISHTTLNTFEGSASAADGAGNLLFYTDGITIWNQQQLIMANGTGLLGNGSTVQSALIVKQPGNQNIYYVFTLDLQGSLNGLRYSIVDMNLAAGMGSVTVKNATITAPCTEQLNGARHCNGIDMWIVTHDLNSNNFKSYLLTSTGLNLTPVISAVGPTPPIFIPNNVAYGQGTIKISPTGKKLGLTFFNGSANSEVAMFDFDKSTGMVSNYFSLITSTVNYYGCEFSGDGTKFYAGSSNGSPQEIYQWNLCAGSNQLVFASKTAVASPSTTSGQFQLAPDGKIYISRSGNQTLSAINNPNLLGIACNYIPVAQSLGTGTVGAGLPNFFGGAFKFLPSFTYTYSPLVSCATVSFSAPPNPTVNSGCGASGYQVLSILWNFGQPLTGAANTPTLNNPTHNFGAPGTYPVKLIFNYQCGADTVYKNITINSPTISVSTSSISCTSPANATVNITGATGPFTYTWLPSAQTTSAATVNPGTYTISINDSNGNCNYTYNTLISPVVPFTGTVNTINTCYGITNGAASINLTMGSGGTGNYVYNWSNGQNTSGVSGLAAGIYSVTVVDANCVISKTFQIVQTPSISLAIISPTNQLCVGNSAILQATASGGGGGLAYSWSGVTSNSAFFMATQNSSGSAIYLVTATDLNGCSQTASTQIVFLASPTLAVQSISICPNGIATLSVSGASNYVWSPGGNTNSTFTISPAVTKVFTVSGSSTNGCSTSTTATITVLKCTSIDEINSGRINLKCYPNPMYSELFIETVEQIDLVIFDLQGQAIIRQKLEIGKNIVFVEELKSGIYFLKALGKNNYFVNKLIKLD